MQLNTTKIKAVIQQQESKNVTFEFLKAMTINTAVTRYATPCSLTHTYQSFRKNCVLHLQGITASLTRVEVTNTWNKSKGCEIASRKGTVGPIHLLAAPVPLLPSTSTYVLP